ncbi:MAG: AAA family ATPase [Solirubrobacteraceae bacterium]|nr:AAA family ATPase [Solirubrobacteraceae bacterium]
MRFKSLCVTNLRAVRRFETVDLEDFIVIAGPNGSGKSCVFDAIRLLKSIYGGYSADEHVQWFGEFGINLQDRDALRRMFRDPQLPVEISATIQYSESERQFLLANSADLAWPIAWQRVTGQRLDHWSFNRMAIATQLAQYREEAEVQVKKITERLTTALTQSSEHAISVHIRPSGDLHAEECSPAEVSFQAFRPEDLGIIEYHSASRTYTRQPLQGINLDSQAFENERRQQSLYNWEAKYQNVKTELASGYLRSLISEASGQEAAGEDLNETLKELFRTFFPDKEYEGIRPLPRGTLEFPVRVPGGHSHDIDDLSSGEKEILYGYLRLRNSTPRQSVILLDEPELHLNPSLLQGFTDFYYRHLGVAQGNQLWLVTHSDTLLRQAIGNSNYRVYHMLSATHSTGNQASEVLLEDDVERVVVDLVGDLAAYRPHAKVVILEGSGEDGFDVAMVRRLFPDFARRVNLVSGGSKKRVRDLYAVLNVATSQIGVSNRFFAVVDRDHEETAGDEINAQEFRWDVYHIENYLLSPAAIRDACHSLAGDGSFSSDDAVTSALKRAAAELVGSLIVERIQAEINTALVDSIAVKGPPDSDNIAHDLAPSIEGSVRRVVETGATYSEAWIAEQAAEHRGDLEAALDSGAWITTFPGRRILKRFVKNELKSIGYEPFRNVVLDKIALSPERAAGMQQVLETILAVDTPAPPSIPAEPQVGEAG